MSEIITGNEAVAYLSGRDAGFATANVVCPNCGFGCTHVEEVRGSNGGTGGRLNANVVFCCEGCSERFALVIHQHKGVSEVQIHKNV